MPEALGLISSTGKNKLVLYKHEGNDQQSVTHVGKPKHTWFTAGAVSTGHFVHSVCCVHMLMGEREQMCSKTPQRWTIVTQSGVSEPATPSSGGLL